MAPSNQWQPVKPLLPWDQGLLDHAISNRNAAPPHVLTVSSPLTVLTRARTLIANGWTRHTLAIDAQGTSVSPESERAVAYCVLGAFKASIFHEPAELVPHKYMETYLGTLWNTANLNYMIDVKHGEIPVVNDYRIKTQQEIVRLFDKTINLLVSHPDMNTWSPK